jgi:hypothetical protein
LGFAAKVLSDAKVIRLMQKSVCTPVVAAGVTEHLWEIEDIVALLD